MIKKHLKKLGAAALIMAMAFSVAACGQKDSGSSSESSTGYPVEITTYDNTGAEVKTTYEKAPERVVAVYQGSIETMIALGLEDHVVASYGLDNEVKDEWKKGFDKMHYKEEPFAPDKEMVLADKPDMILSWGSLFSDKNLGNVNNWIDQGINTYINTNTRVKGDRTLENEYTDILNIGKIFNVEDKAQKLVDEMKKQVETVKEETKGQEPVSVAVVEPINGKFTNYGKTSLGGDMVTQLGGKLSMADVKDMGKEDLINADPDVIFVVYMAYAGDNPKEVMDKQMSLIKDDPAFANLKAVKNGNVHLVMLGDMYAAGPRTIDGIKTFAKGMYPKLDIK